MRPELMEQSEHKFMAEFDSQTQEIIKNRAAMIYTVFGNVNHLLIKRRMEDG